MTPDLFQRATGCSVALADKWADPASAAMQLWGIDTPLRQAHFLAQVGHESGGFVYVREIWGPTPAQTRYEGRADLGNTHPGDGKLFMGRGLIQVTGRANYAAVSKALNVDFVNSPALLETPTNAALSAAWFWQAHGLNALADADDVIAVTKRINGGTNGLEDRQLRTARAKQALC